ncbi:unnamed protein product [Closterium sp. NIES-64]|nr:unnamed protein product [Closterium sp. NIES-64]
MQLASRDAASRGVVANRVLIPCFLAVHVASAVSSEPELVLSSLPLMAFAQPPRSLSVCLVLAASYPLSSRATVQPHSVLCAASLGHLAHQSSPQSSSSSSFLPRPLHLSPLPSTALHQLAAAISVSLSSLNQPAAEPTTEPAAKSAAAAGGSDAAGNLGGRLGAPVMTLLLLVVMTAVCETGGGGDGLAGQLALLAVGGWAPALLILACNALLWIQTRPDAMDSSLLSSPSGPSLSNHFFTPPVLGVLAGLLIGATPLSQLFLLPRVTDGLADTSTLLIDSGSLLAWLQGQAGEMAGCMHCLMEAASFLGSAALPLHLMALVSSLTQHQQWYQQQQAILSTVELTQPRDPAASAPELSL